MDDKDTCRHLNEKCKNETKSRGLCQKHYMRELRIGDINSRYPIEYVNGCSVDECSNPNRSSKSPYCEVHYYRLRRNGHLAVTIRKSIGMCLQCDKETTKVFCSGRCQTRSNRGRDENDRICLNCSSSISRNKRKDKTFCSKACNHNWRWKNDPEFKENLISYIYQRKKGMTGSHTATEWISLLEFYNHSCLVCGIKEDITRDHVIPICCGGTDDIENLQPLCRSHNSAKYTKTIDYRGDTFYAAMEFVKTKRP